MRRPPSDGDAIVGFNPPLTRPLALHGSSRVIRDNEWVSCLKFAPPFRTILVGQTHFS